VTEPDSQAAAPPKTKQGTDWWAEARSLFWLVLAVLGFHSFIAKPFYIPSESTGANSCDCPSPCRH
jgi:signal peptidase I